jgi:hypothetical protein
VKTKVVLGEVLATGYQAGTTTPLRATWNTFSGSMLSLSNPWPPPPLSRADVGGPWVQDYVSDIRNKIRVDVTLLGRRVVGDVALTFTPSVSLPSMPLKTEAQARAFGTTAIANTEPTAEYFSGSQALGELVMDGLPGGATLHLMRDRVALARSSGDAYLDAEFGWLPLVRDVKSLCKAVRRSDEIMRAYTKGSEKRIRRRFGLPSTAQSSSSSGGIFSLGPDLGSTVGNAAALRQGTTVMKSETRTYFSGAFRYHIPATAATSAISRFALTARKVYGVEVTPELLWNIAPWSWAHDWFGNVGDVMHNVSALGRDGMVMEYGYVMDGRVVDIDQAVGSNYGTFTRKQKIVSRKRYSKLSPYGFGVSWSGLSPKQLAVTAALGLSRAPF